MRFDEYNKLSLGVDCVILSTGLHQQKTNRNVACRCVQVLLLKRNITPYENMWSIPGGLVEDDKGLLETLDSKLFKKTSIHNIFKKQFHTYGDDVYRDPRGRVVSVAYMALGPKEIFAELKDSGYGEVKWFWAFVNSQDELIIRDPDTGLLIENLAFDHKKILKDALLELRRCTEVGDMAIQLMPEKFTVRELQDVYEDVCGRELNNFRRIADRIAVETDEIDTGKAHRPAKLYKRRDNT